MRDNRSPAPRIHIEFAAAAPVAVILSRGPSKWCRLFVWNIDDDSVQPGSWLHGRIYENGCSLSPDGGYFAYLALSHHAPRTRGAGYAWTAISKPPWLTALALWPQDDTWGGRTAFAGNHTLIIDCPHWRTLHTDDILPDGFTVIPRWVGTGAPEQSLPPVPRPLARFHATEGIDPAGRKIEYTDGILRCGGRTIVHLMDMTPTPHPPPPEAGQW